MIPDGVTSIGTFAFCKCSGLTSITIPNGVTSIGSYAFESCSSLKSIYFKGSKPTLSSSIFDGVTATAYYPADDSSWDRISDEDVGGTITWVAYDPSTLEDASAAGVDAAAGISSEDTESLFTDSAEDTSDSAPEASISEMNDSEETAAEVEAAIEEEAEVEALEEGTAEPEVTFSDAEIEADMVVTEVEVPVSYSTEGAEASSGTEVSYTDLTPDAPYVFAVVRSGSASDLFAPDNLLYINQKNADGSGSESFQYVVDGTEGFTTVIFGKHQHSYGEPEFIWNGTSSCTAVFTCKTGTDCGGSKTLDCTITSKVDSCVCTGGTIYTATAVLGGKTYTSTKSEVSSHSWSEWKTAKAATALEAGSMERSCSVCGTKETDTIAKLEPTVTLSVTAKKTYPLQVKQKYTIKVSGLTDGDSVVSWKSSKPKVASVNKSGRITAKKTGKATITLKLKSGLTTYIKVKVQKGKVKTTSLKVQNASTGKTVAKKISLKKGGTLKLKTAVTPVTSQQKVTYKTSNKKIVTVTSKGVIKARKKGKATITVKSGKKSVKIKITVK